MGVSPMRMAGTAMLREAHISFSYNGFLYHEAGDASFERWGKPHPTLQILVHLVYFVVFEY